MSRYRVLVLALMMAGLFSAAVIPAAAQTSLAALRGKVTDQQGGVLPGATVTVKQASRTRRTGSRNSR